MVDDPPVVVEIAPAPWIVTELLKVCEIPFVPVHAQVPAGIAIMSPSAGDTCSAVIAA